MFMFSWNSARDPAHFDEFHLAKRQNSVFHLLFSSFVAYISTSIHIQIYTCIYFPIQFLLLTQSIDTKRRTIFEMVSNKSLIHFVFLLHFGYYICSSYSRGVCVVCVLSANAHKNATIVNANKRV